MPRAEALAPTAHEKRQQQREDRRAKAAALASGDNAEALDLAPRLSHEAQVVKLAFPPALIQEGRITRQSGQTNRGHFAPEFFAANPQHGRTVSRIVEQLARSFDAHGQQEPILARLITDADRKLWPEAANSARLFFIIDGHQRCKAISSSTLDQLWAEIVLPDEEESEVDYRRRCLTMASIKMMQSQAYDVFDKVQQVKIWMAEFGVPQLPSKRELAKTFHISATEAQRIRTVTRLDPEVECKIKEADTKPADEVIAMIANFPLEGQLSAYERIGKLPVSEARALLKREKQAALTTKAPGRPHNYIYRVNDSESDIISIITCLTPEQWKAKGGTAHFWQSVQKIGHSREHQDRLKADLD